MEVIVRGHHLDLTDSLKEYVEAKVGPLDRYFKEAIRAEVELTFDVSGREHNAFCASGRVVVPGPDILAEERAGDLHAAVDLMQGKLKIQLLKLKERRSPRRSG